MIICGDLKFKPGDVHRFHSHAPPATSRQTPDSYRGGTPAGRHAPMYPSIPACVEASAGGHALLHIPNHSFIYSTTATIRTGPPLPCSIFIGNAIIVNPVAGN